MKSSPSPAHRLYMLLIPLLIGIGTLAVWRLNGIVRACFAMSSAHLGHAPEVYLQARRHPLSGALLLGAASHQKL